VTLTIDHRQCLGRGNRNVIGGDADNSAVAFPENPPETVQFFRMMLTDQMGGMDGFVPTATIGLVCEP
jgi:hypothetical protein